MVQPSRKFDAGSGYRYGFNGKEKDNSTGEGNLDFGARIYDARISRWLSVDPLQDKFPSLSPYLFSLNNPILFVDPDGREVIINKASVSNDGTSFPTKVEDMGNTRMSLTFRKNKTGAYDVVVDQHIQYCAALNSPTFMSYNKSLAELNPGLKTCVEIHEKEHYERNIKAAQTSIEMADPFNPGQKLIGTADVIYTKAMKTLDERVSAAKADINNQVTKQTNQINSMPDDADKAKLLKQLTDSKNKAMKKIEADKAKSVKNITNAVINQVYATAAPLQVHTGPTGVNASAAAKMPPASQAYQNGKPIAVGANGYAKPN